MYIENLGFYMISYTCYMWDTCKAGLVNGLMKQLEIG